MRQEAKHIAETAAGLAAANAAVWTLQDISLVVSILMGLVSTCWVMAQFSKFMLRWWREEVARSKGAPPTDYDKLGG